MTCNHKITINLREVLTDKSLSMSLTTKGLLCVFFALLFYHLNTKVGKETKQLQREGKGKLPEKTSQGNLTIRVKKNWVQRQEGNVCQSTLIC